MSQKHKRQQFKVFITRQSKEFWLLRILGGLFVIILMRLFWVQVITGFTYESTLIKQHFTTQNIKARRGNIYVTDSAGKSLQLTESIDLYTISIDPKYVLHKDKIIELVTPYIYQHFCNLRGTKAPSVLECIQGLETFTQQKILPPTKHQFFVIQPENQSGQSLSGEAEPGVGMSGVSITNLNDPSLATTGITTFNEQEYSEYLVQRQEVINNFTREQGIALIKTRLEEAIKTGARQYNFVTFVENAELLNHLANNPVPYLMVANNFYLYTQPDQVQDLDQAVQQTQILFAQYGITMTEARVRTLLSPQQNRYLKLMDGVSSIIATNMMNVKQGYVGDKERTVTITGTTESVPLLHGLGFEQTSKRHYPYGSFMANILGFVDTNNKALYGIEEYFDKDLAGKDGVINGLGTPWVGEVASNELDIDPAQDGKDITLTINPTIQRELESIIKGYDIEFRSDSVSVMIMDPRNGNVIASANHPTFDPNEPNEVYQVKPLGPENRNLVLDQTYVDIPIYLLSGTKLLPATTTQRFDLSIPKYIHKNINGPSVFIDKLIAYPYEPGSIFKPITAAIGMDVDEISLYDRYYDAGSLTIGPFEIKNVARACLGTHDFLHALQYSCNVGMIRIIQKIRDYVFYNYLDRLGFGKLTGIELAGEQAGMIPEVSKVSRATFYNNSFGQGLTTTPIQIAQAYAALVNGGYLIQPTIIKSIGNQLSQSNQNKRVKIFKDITSTDIVNALFMVVNQGQIRQFALPGYSLGGKTGTSQIAYRGKYQQGAGWTNGSFAGIITRDNLKYVLVVQIRRPRASVWGELTAGKIFGDIAKFLILYEGIEE